MKTALVLIIAILAQATGNIILSKAMRHVGLEGLSSNNWLQVLMHAAQNPMIWLGTLLLLVFFALYSAALSWADLSFVLPATSFGYIVNVAFAHHFLRETVSPLRWFGTILIAIGVILVSRTAIQTAQKETTG
jgi:uncharacterized membrane protein